MKQKHMFELRGKTEQVSKNQKLAFRNMQSKQEHRTTKK